MSKLISEKRKLWKEWKNGGDKEPYLAAKWLARQGVFKAKKESEEKKCKNMKLGNDTVFRIASQMRKTNQDVVGEVCQKR